MDVLVSGSERAPLRLPSPPRWLVVLVVVALVGAAAAAVLAVRRAEARAAATGDVQVGLRLLSSTREYGGALYGTLEVVVSDPRRDGVRLDAVEVEVPGVHHAPARGLPRTSAEVAVPLRFVVFSCDQLALPGRVALRVARGDRPARAEHRAVTLDGDVDGSPLLVACGRLPQPGTEG